MCTHIGSQMATRAARRRLNATLLQRVPDECPLWSYECVHCGERVDAPVGGALGVPGTGVRRWFWRNFPVWRQVRGTYWDRRSERWLHGLVAILEVMHLVI